MGHRIRHLSHDIELPPGDFIIGRGAECQLALDDALISRRHAAIVVREGSAFVRDLGSRNGVFVNGFRLLGERLLATGDVVRIGSQELVFASDETAGGGAFARPFQQTVGSSRGDRDDFLKAADATRVREPNAPATPLALVTSLAEKALGMGRSDEAERLLQTMLGDILTRSRAGQTIASDVTDKASHFAARLARATGKGEWVRYTVELHRSPLRVMPAAVVDELYTAVRKVDSVDLHALRSYLQALREKRDSLSPAERFILQRIEGLERLAALR